MAPHGIWLTPSVTVVGNSDIRILPEGALNTSCLGASAELSLSQTVLLLSEAQRQLK